MQTTDYFEPKRLLAADPAIATRLAARQAEIAAGSTVTSTTRAGLMMGGAVLATAAIASDVFAQNGGMPSLVIDILNFALTLEHLEAEFYVRGVGTTGLIPSDMRAPFDQIRKHEVAHVAFLQGVLGSRAIAKPTFDYTAGGGSGNGPFADVFRNAQTFAAVAQTFEDTGVRAYKGQAATLMPNPTILEAALRIHSVEARHAARIRRMRRAAAGAGDTVRWSGTVRGGGVAAAGATDAGPQPTLVTAAFNAIYGAGANATTAPSEANVTHAGINVSTLAGASFGLEAAQEAFDEPLDRADVIAIVQPFFIPMIS